MTNFLIYGPYGYTGNLIAGLAIQRGHKPLLAGRNAQKLAAQAAELALLHRVLRLDQPDDLDAALAGVDAVLHCAGPYQHTAKPMVEACLRTRTHYLDITGELPVLEALAGRDSEARSAGIVILPSVGFDVVPSDCLAAHLKRRLPTATRLTLGLRTVGGGISRGTAITGLEMLDRAGMIRRSGRLTPIPAGSKSRQIDFGRGPTHCVSIPWGDLSTAYASTGIPNIEVYFAAPPAAGRAMSLFRPLAGLLMTGPFQRLLKAAVHRLPPGPNEAQLRDGIAIIWGQVEDDAGQRAVSRLTTPETYAMTAQAALASSEAVLAGQVSPGFHTPASAFGPDFILQFAGVKREDLPP